MINEIKYCKLHFITHRIIYFLPASVYIAENRSTLFCFRKRTVPLSAKKKRKRKQKLKACILSWVLSAASRRPSPQKGHTRAETKNKASVFGWRERGNLRWLWPPGTLKADSLPLPSAWQGPWESCKRVPLSLPTFSLFFLFDVLFLL